MQSSPAPARASIALAANLNALLAGTQTIERAAAAVIGDDVAHHLFDPEAVLGLDPLAATPLASVLGPLATAEPEQWILALPRPGAPGGLRGPALLLASALDAGEVVIGASGRLALVPHRVGPAVQWRIHSAARPMPPPAPYDAERALSEVILDAADTLLRLDVAGFGVRGPAAAGARPNLTTEIALAPGYPARRHATAARAARLIAACDLALDDDGASLSSHEVQARSQQLRRVRAVATDALCSAVTWMRS